MYLFTDIDNTILFSRKHENKFEDVVWAEYLNGKKQGFIPRNIIEVLGQYVVPVTLRTYAQYMRIKEAFQNTGIMHAMIRNGGTLLVNGIPDITWEKETKRLAEADLPVFYSLMERWKDLYGTSVITDQYIFYRKATTGEVLLTEEEKTHVCVIKDSRKTYIVPKSLTKGFAVKRYMERFGKEPLMAAGDSENDISMLNMAEICFAPEKLHDKISCPEKYRELKVSTDIIRRCLWLTTKH